MASFRQVLEAIVQTWTERRGEVSDAAQQIAAHLGQPRTLPGEAPPSPERLDAAVERLATEFDAEFGGFGRGAPKFPPSMVLEFLVRHHRRTADPRSLEMVETTCERMARGGMYDQLAGGFARYSVDREWIVPHFEKMLYDNALLRVYAHVWRATGSPLAERVTRETARFLMEDLHTPEGGFASSLDADTIVDGSSLEGATYVWTPAQLREVLGETDGAWAADLLGVTESGTFEHGTSTLQLQNDPDDSERWASVRDRLMRHRVTRPQPARDDKVVAAWNGLAIAALADAGVLLGEPEWIEAAVVCAELLVRLHLDESGRMHRASRDGEVGSYAGSLDDHANVAEGFLALVAATGDPVWLSFAEQVLDVILARHADPAGGFFDTADDRTDDRLSGIRRPQDPTDNATPSGWSAAAGALLTFAAYTGSEVHRDAAEAALGVYDVLGAQAPRFAGWGLAVAEALVAGPVEVAVIGRDDDPRTAELWLAAMHSGAPGAAVAVGEPDSPLTDAIPLLRGRPMADGSPAAYVCRQFVCHAPTTDPDELTAVLSE